jgi:hypothetical protein
VVGLDHVNDTRCHGDRDWIEAVVVLKQISTGSKEYK